MYILSSIAPVAFQQLSISIENNPPIQVALRYYGTQSSWFMDVTWGDTFVASGIHVVVSPNFMRQFRHLVPFGIGCYTDDLLEPISLEAFANGSATLVVLNADDVTTVEETLFAALN